mmetsp:Transcript_36329/g.82304  ORF Transcript_36329/g.82304 Transcript_36329/m.82304 type:complete len:655 (+) Transcript_36329:84-2048(+)
MTAPQEAKLIQVPVKARGAGPAVHPLPNAKLDFATDDLLGESIGVPPIVIIEKLEELLKKGKFAVHFHADSSVEWGFNGRIKDVWHSFRCTESGACEYVDESIWHAEAVEVWTEEELEQLKQLKSKAEQKPTTRATQPTGREPGNCHRTAAMVLRPKPAHAKPPPPKATEPEMVQPPPPAETETAEAAETEPAEEAVARDLQPEQPQVAPVRKRSVELPEGVLQVQELMREVKARLCEADKSAYKKLLGEICSGGGVQVLEDWLAGEGDLLDWLNELKGAAKVKVASTGSGDALGGLKAKAPPAKKKAPSKASVREDLLKTYRADTDDIAGQLVRMLYFGTSTKASQRLLTLRYARTWSPSKEGTREMFILRGLPGVDKKEWVLKHLRSQVELAEDVVAAAITVHFCTITTFEAELAQKASNQAAAANEARATFLTELGVTPVYVGGVHLHLHEMAEYVRLGKEANYTVKIISPEEVFPGASNVDALTTELERQHADIEDKSTLPSREELEAMLQDFQPLPEDGDALEAILAAEPNPAAGIKRPLDTGIASASKVPKAHGAAIAKGPRPPPGPPPEGKLAQSSDAPPGAKLTIAKRPPSAKSDITIAKRPPGEKATMPIAKRPPGAKAAIAIAKRPPPKAADDSIVESQTEDGI